MSRVAKNPISVPAGVDVNLAGRALTLKGPQGTLTQNLHELVSVQHADGQLKIAPVNDSTSANALAGTTRAILANMVQGVSKGFERKLMLVGVGYRAQAQGDKLSLSLGFSHPVEHVMPAGVKCETPTQTEILLKGADKQKIGQVAADVRAYRPPEPYKGKGVRYADEVVSLKETKKK
jgi:large subunit ribosomal protein L6